MANWDTLKSAINSVIKDNNNQEITGELLRSTLNSIVNSLGEYADFKGTATPTTSMTASDGPAFYLAATKGNYANGLSLGEGEIAAFIYNNGSWQKEIITTFINASFHSGGVINLSSADAKSIIDSKIANYKVGDIVLFVIGDSKGAYPSLSGETRINVAKNLCISTNYFFSTDNRGANVGDMLFVSKQTVTLITRTVCKIIPLNDAKVASGDWYGTEGVMTPNDKATLNAALPRAEQMPSRWTSNMNDALQTGVYPWCTLGRPAGSTGAYTCIVQRTSTNDGNYDTIEQTAYGREGELGQVYKRIIFYKSDGTDTQYGDWLQVSSAIKALPTKYDDAEFHTVIDSVVKQGLYQGYWGEEKYMLDCVVHKTSPAHYMQCIYGNLNVDSSNTKRLIVSNNYRIIRRAYYDGSWAKWEVIADVVQNKPSEQHIYPRKVILVGDSQIALCKNSNNTLEDIVKDRLKTEVYNFAFAGARWAYRTEGSEYNAFSVLNVLSALCNKDTSAMDGSVGSVGPDYLADYSNTVNNLKSFLSTVGMGDGSEWAIIVSAGGNDFNGKTPLTDVDNYTLFGAMKNALSMLSRTYPAMLIHIVSPTYRMMNDGISSDTYTHWVEPVGQMTRREYGDKILDYARQEFHLPVFDMYRNGGRNSENIWALCPDGTHPTSDAGIKATADMYVKILHSFST